MDHIHTFSTTQGHGEPPRMSDQPNARATSKTAQTWKTIHTKHIFSHPNEANMEWWLRRANDTRVSWGPKVSRHLSYRWGKTRKNLTQETCPDRGSNPGPLRDKRACYHMLHSGGHLYIISTLNVSVYIFNKVHFIALNLCEVGAGQTLCNESSEYLLCSPQCRERMLWKLSCGAMPMSTSPFIAVPPPPALPQDSTNLDPGLMNGDQSLPIHSAIGDVRQGSESNGPVYGAPNKLFSKFQWGEWWHEINAWECGMKRTGLKSWRLLVGWNWGNGKTPQKSVFT